MIKTERFIGYIFGLQSAFHITFNDKDILERRFDFLDNIVAAVQEKVENVV